MARHGKNFRESYSKVDRAKEYPLKEALTLLKDVNYAKFDASVECHFNVKYKSIQNVRGSLQLPHGTGKKVKVLVFAKAEKAEEAQNAGADYVGDSDLIAKVSGGWIDFDFVVATPDMMKDVGKLGPVLGKKGLMPKPKSGTVTTDIAGIVSQLKAGRIEYRADKTGVVHLGLGKMSFAEEQLEENIEVAFKTILKDKPSDAKGDYVVSAYLASTMSPGIRLDLKELRG